MNTLSDTERLSVETEKRLLARVAAIETEVSNEEATEFVISHPKVNLVHGDFATGYGFVGVPLLK